MRYHFAQFIFTTLSLMLALPALSADEEPEPNCFVTVTTTKKDKEKTTRTFSSHVKSKEACASYAKGHEKNFAPHSIEKKSVTYKWVEPSNSGYK